MLNLVQDKTNIKTKIFKLQNKKYNSYKPEKTPEKYITNINIFEKNLSNLKSKKSEINLNLTNSKNINNKANNVSNPSQNSNINISLKNKQISPKIELTVSSIKSDQKKSIGLETTSTEKSTIVAFNNESNYLLNESNTNNLNYSSNVTNHPNYIYSHYNKGIVRNGNNSKNYGKDKNSQNQSKFINSYTVDYSYKIIELMEKMKRFLTLSSQNQSLILNKGGDTNNFAVRSNFDGLFPTLGGKHVKKNLSVEFDLLTNKLYLEMSQNNDLIKNNNINLIYKEIEMIYNGSSELNESLKANMFNTIDENNDDVKFESTKMNLNSINNSSERIENLYIKLFGICKDCLAEIKTIILESDQDHEKNEFNNKNLYNINKLNLLNKNDFCSENKEASIELKKNDFCSENKEASIEIKPIKICNNLDTNYEIKPKIDNLIKVNSNLSNNNLVMNKNDKNENDRNKLIYEKLEMLKNLKEKKEQLLNQKSVKFDESVIKVNKTIRNTNLTEIDPSESILNENAQIKIPTSNICEVNKPTTNNNNYKIYRSEEEHSYKNDSQIILNFDDFQINDEIDENKENENIDEQEENEKSINETVMETGNSFIKNHKRSRSQVIQKQLYTYSVKPQ